MLRKILPHAAIIMSVMYFVFFFIDKVNSAMAFINNDMTKVLLLILCVISVINAVLLFADDRKRVRLRRQQEARQRAAAQQRTMQQLSLLVEKLGCKVAYNLDGGQTSFMVWNDQVANVPSGGGRRCSAAVMLLDLAG